MPHQITVLPQKQNIAAAAGDNLLACLRAAGFAPDAPCGGTGCCGKCKVMIEGKEVLACQTVIDRDMTVTLPTPETQKILTDSVVPQGTVSPVRGRYLLAFDIGTTTVVGYLLDGKTGSELASEGMRNPQSAFGADVVSRIQHALSGQLDALTSCIHRCVEEIILSLCNRANIKPSEIGVVSLVGNPAMQQLFLGIRPENLAQIPFAPVLIQAKTVSAKAYLPMCENAELLIVPDISGFVGADTVACVLATKLDEQEEITLLVDIGTNGEMVLGNKHRMVACSTAAGPALEGANIQFGMRGQAGAIDHVWQENGQIKCSVIGDGEAVGICGSGLIDAVAAALDAGLLNDRGKIQNENRVIRLTDKIILTQEDIRQVQLAKGAIAAGIELMAAHLEIELKDIKRVHLAGAFGTFMDPGSACRIGLLPSVLEAKIKAVGNAAGGGAKMLACNAQELNHAQQLITQIKFIELAAIPTFQRCFAQNMRFDTAQKYWIKKALALGFSDAVPLDISTLKPRQDVRNMCSADKCRAFGKNWTCPPHCGTLAECEAKMQCYSRGILLQTIGKTAKAIDTKAYRRTEEHHLNLFHQLAGLVRSRYPDALCLGSGGCRICKECAYPQPCRFPDGAYSSMEGYGLFVTQVCRDNGIAYYHGEKTITYTACILLP